MQRDVNRPASNAQEDRARQSKHEGSDNRPRAPARRMHVNPWPICQADYFSFQDSPPNVTCTPERNVNGTAGYPKASL